jgi:hypothetical protein
VGCKKFMKNITFFDCVLAAYFVLVIYGIFKGAGDNRSIIIFKDYDDLGLTFLIPASYALSYALITSIGGGQLIANILGAGEALTLLLKLSKNTYLNNEQCIKKRLCCRKLLSLNRNSLQALYSKACKGFSHKYQICLQPFSYKLLAK